MRQALAEKEGEGMAKMIYRKDTGEILGVHILGLHAADLIHEASNAVATKQRVQVSVFCPVYALRMTRVSPCKTHLFCGLFDVVNRGLLKIHKTHLLPRIWTWP